MNYNIIDHISGLPIRNFSEEDLTLQAKLNNITIFDMYHLAQKEIQKTGIEYILNLDTLKEEVILKGLVINENIHHFEKYQQLLTFLDKK